MPPVNEHEELAINEPRGTTSNERPITAAELPSVARGSCERCWSNAPGVRRVTTAGRLVCALPRVAGTRDPLSGQRMMVAQEQATRNSRTSPPAGSVAVRSMRGNRYFRRPNACRIRFTNGRPTRRLPTPNASLPDPAQPTSRLGALRQRAFPKC